ncbi:hypothetical protein PR048_006918 [Dryococelus australis]|uniref:Uncharacterized protein n=1 Tax=Dryococelus australis TaxID=614101 RepID=A0ABQ9ICA3_9NEOP|nr:hypothetical protein PR048_006918 [Dryococelus australis]
MVTPLPFHLMRPSTNFRPPPHLPSGISTHTRGSKARERSQSCDSLESTQASCTLLAGQGNQERFMWSLWVDAMEGTSGKAMEGTSHMCNCAVEELTTSSFSGKSFEQKRNLILHGRSTSDMCIATKQNQVECSAKYILNQIFTSPTNGFQDVNKC